MYDWDERCKTPAGFSDVDAKRLAEISRWVSGFIIITAAESAAAAAWKEQVGPHRRAAGAPTSFQLRFVDGVPLLENNKELKPPLEALQLGRFPYYSLFC